jgi:hypothetical protein
MAKSKAVAFKRTSTAANERTEAERSSKLGAPDEAAGDIDAIIAEHVDDEVEIGKRAHAIWEAEGRPDRLELEHWLRARSEHAKKA